MLVSVIVPVYNKAAFVQRSIDSILIQTYNTFELILVNDGSTDESAEILDLNKEKDSRVKVIHQKNSGPGAARNTGILESKGELIAFLDADDEWLPEYLEKSVQILTKAPSEVSCVASCYFEYPEQKSMVSEWIRRGVRQGVFKISANTDPNLVITLLAFMSSWSVVSKVESLRTFQGFYDRYRCTYAEDAHLWLKILLNRSVTYNLEPLVKYHRDASDLTKMVTSSRPVEPFLEDPESIEEFCPSEHRGLLREILFLRAIKTACVVGFWGNFVKAQELMNKFSSKNPFRYKLYIPALIFSKPILGPFIGYFLRKIRQR